MDTRFMSTTAVLDVAIGLIMMYFVLSLVCTTINEFIAQLLSLRARTLSSGLDRLIDDNGLLQAFRQHGRIDAIDSLVDGHPSYVSSRAVADAIIGSLNPDKPIPGMADVLQAVQKLPDSNIRDILFSAATNVGNDVKKFRDEISTWFDNSMDRLSGVYKRYMQWLSLLVGLLLAIVINADTIVVVDSLWSDGSLRAEIIGMVDKTVSTSATLQSLSQTVSTLPAIEAEVRPFPIGWTNVSGRTDQNWQSSVKGIFAKILGLLITGLALSLGAPFWFDLLSKFMNVRSTGAKPDEAFAT